MKRIVVYCITFVCALLQTISAAYGQRSKPVAPVWNPLTDVHRFERGDISFRIVPDTLAAPPKFRLQRKEGDAWKEIAAFPWTQYGYDVDRDANNDGSNDLIWRWRRQDETYLYDPEALNFVRAGLTGKNPRRLTDSLDLYYAYWRTDEYNGFASELYTFAGFKKVLYGKITVETDHRNGDLLKVTAKKMDIQNPASAVVVENIDPATAEEARDYYIGYEKFIKAYWEKNRQKFIR